MVESRDESHICVLCQINNKNRTNQINVKEKHEYKCWLVSRCSLNRSRTYMYLDTLPLRAARGFLIKPRIWLMRGTSDDTGSTHLLPPLLLFVFVRGSKVKQLFVGGL